MFFVLYFGDAEVGILLLEVIRVDENGLMPEKLFT